MTPADVLRTAFVSLGANKLRAVLTLLGIVIGVSAVITLMSLGRGAQESITSRIEDLGTNLLFVRPGESSAGGSFGGLGSANTLTLGDAYALVDPQAAPSVAAAAPEMRTSGQVVAKGNNTFTQIVGVTPEYEAVRNSPVQQGQFISEAHVRNRSEVAVLGAPIAEQLFGFRSPIGQHMRISGRDFTVIGVLPSQGGGFFGVFGNRGAGAHHHRPLPAELRANGAGRRDRELHQRQREGRQRVAGYDKRDNGGAAAAPPAHRRERLYGNQPGGDDRSARGDHQHLRGVPGSDSRHLAACGRHRRYEHNAGVGHRANAGRLAYARRWVPSGAT